MKGKSLTQTIEGVGYVSKITLEGIVSTCKPVVEGIASTCEKGIEYLVSGYKLAKSYVKKAASKCGSGIEYVVSTYGPYVKKAISKTGEYIEDKVSKYAEYVKKAVYKFKEYIGDKFSEYWTYVKEGVDYVKLGYQKQKALYEALQKMFKFYKEKAELYIKGKISEYKDKAVSYIKDKISDYKQKRLEEKRKRLEQELVEDAIAYLLDSFDYESRYGAKPWKQWEIKRAYGRDIAEMLRIKTGLPVFYDYSKDEIVEYKDRKGKAYEIIDFSKKDFGFDVKDSMCQYLVFKYGSDKSRIFDEYAPLREVIKGQKEKM